MKTIKKIKLFCALLILTFMAGCSTLDLINNSASIINTNNLAENLLIGKFVRNYKKEKPISTNITDAYKMGSNIKD